MPVCVELNKASPSNFELSFPLLPGQNSLLSNEELVLNIYGAILPALNISPLEQDWQGTKRKVASSPVEFEIMPVQFIVDAAFKNWKLLYNWITYISNNKDKMMENYDRYAVDTSLRVLDNFNNAIIAVNFKGMWPTNLQEVSFSHKEGEVQLEGGVTFVFDYYEVVENI
jgi:hypothetical protein